MSPLNRKRPEMNKTEPVRASDGVRQFGSSRLPEFDTVGLTNSDSRHAPRGATAVVRNSRTSALPESRSSELPVSATFELPTAVRS